MGYIGIRLFVYPHFMNSTEHQLLWTMLPGELEPFFEVQDFEITPTKIRVTLVEKNTVPSPLPEEYRGRRVINSVLRPVLMDYFPIRGRHTEILVKRRAWQFQGIEKLFKRDLKLCFKGTKLEKEFAAFLKELDRKRAD